MTNGNRGRVYSLIALVLVVVTGVAVHQRNSSGKAAATAKKTPMVAVMPVQLSSIARTIETTGTVEPENAVNIIPKIEQRIAWMPLREGAQVRKGQVIVRLENTESADQLSAALAEVSVAEAKLRDVLSGSRPQEIKSSKAALAQAEANYKQASRDLEHTRKLYGATGIPEQQLQEAQSRYDSAEAILQDAEIELRRLKRMLDIGGVSQEDVDKAQTRYQLAKSAFASAKSNLSHVKELNARVIPEQQMDNAEARHASAKSALEAAKARLDLLQEGASSTQISVAREQVSQARLKAKTIRTQSEYCIIKSPVNGVITKVFLSEGDMAQTRQPIMSISDGSGMIVKAALTDREAAKVSAGRLAMVKLGGPTDEPLKLKVTRVYPSADHVTRLVPIEIALPRSINVSQGAFIRVSLVMEQRNDAVVIPADAVLQKPGGKSIAFVVKDGIAAARPIQAGIESKGKVEVLSGVNPGEMLVVRGHEMLRDGAEVKAKPQRKSPGGTMPQPVPGQGTKKEDRR